MCIRDSCERDLTTVLKGSKFDRGQVINIMDIIDKDVVTVAVVTSSVNSSSRPQHVDSQQKRKLSRKSQSYCFGSITLRKECFQKCMTVWFLVELMILL